MDRDILKSKVNEIKKDFSFLNNNPNITYLDSGATSLKPTCVLDKMNEYYSLYGVNIHRGVYNASYIATLEYDNARKKVAKFINASQSEIIFTKNVTEALNVLCLMYSDLLNEGDEIISSYLEHHSSILPWQVIAKKKKLCLSYIPLNEDARLDSAKFEEMISEKTKVLVITYVSNVMGYKNDIKEFIRIAHEHNIIVIVDAAQAVQHLKIDVRDLDCDFLAFSGHKMMGPTGIGVLYGKKSLLKKLKPVFYGGDMNEEVYPYEVDIKEVPYCFESGTPPIAEAIGLGMAIDYIEKIGFEFINEHEKSLIEYIKESVKDIEGLTVYNKNMDTPILSFNIDGVHPHDAASFFDESGICIRAGHHCAQLLTKFLGCNGTLRASFYIYNDFDDVDRLVSVIKRVIEFFKEFGV